MQQCLYGVKMQGECHIVLSVATSVACVHHSRAANANPHQASSVFYISFSATLKKTQNHGEEGDTVLYFMHIF